MEENNQSNKSEENLEHFYEQLIERSEKPNNKLSEKEINTNEYNVFFKDQNPLCGDKISMYLKIEDNKIKDAVFTGEGCIISMASADLLIDKIKGMNINEVISLDENFIRNLIKIPLGVNRIKCAMLSLKVAKVALIDFLNKSAQ